MSRKETNAAQSFHLHCCFSLHPFVAQADSAFFGAWGCTICCHATFMQGLQSALCLLTLACFSTATAFLTLVQNDLR